MEKRVYFQTQGRNLQGENFHSDGCMDPAQMDRDFFHALLDEWLNSFGNIQDGDVVDGMLDSPHLIFGVCRDH